MTMRMLRIAITKVPTSQILLPWANEKSHPPSLQSFSFGCHHILSGKRRTNHPPASARPNPFLEPWRYRRIHERLLGKRFSDVYWQNRRHLWLEKYAQQLQKRLSGYS